MLMFSIIPVIPLILTVALILINFFLSFKTKKDREKPSPFECGFNPITHARLPFSIQFFIVAIVFLIFDIEIIILIPIIPSMKINSNLFSWFNSIFLIFLILLIGLIYEWNERSIIWTY